MGYVGTAPAEKYTTIDKQTLTGNSTVGPYTLTHSVGNEQEIEVFVNNVRQEPGVSYTVSSNQLTMSASVDSADDFYVIFQGKAKMTATHPPTFDLTAANGTFTGTVTTGGLTVGSDTAKTKFYSNSTYNGIYNGSALTNNESIYMGSGTLFFYSGGGERMRIDSSGNVGIGTTNPLSRLHINNTSSAFYMGYGSNQDIYLQTTNGNIIFTDYNAANERVRIDSSGNVGIGTTSPTSKLTVGSSSIAAGTGLFQQIQTAGNNMYVGVGSNNSAYIQANGEFRIATGGYADRVTVDSSGNVGIGGSPSRKLHIIDSGDTYVAVQGGTSSKAGIFFGDSDNHTLSRVRHDNTDNSLQFSTNEIERMRILSTGDIAFGNSVANTASGYSNQPGGGYVASDSHFEFATTSNRSAAEIGKNNANDGQLVSFRKQGTTVGDIGVNNSDNLRIQGNSGHSGIEFGTNAIFPHKNSSNVDATIDLGESTLRFKDLYISNRITNSGSGGVRIDGTNHAYIRKKGTQQYQFDCGSFTAGQGKKIFTTGSWTAGGGSITVFQNAGFFGVGQFSFILHYGGCAFTLQHGTSNYATFSVNLNTPGSGQTEVYLTMGYAMSDVRIFLNFDGYPYYGSGALVGSAASGITMTEVSHHTLT